MVSPQSTGSPVIVEIMDPVAGYQYVLDTVNKVAHRMALASATNRPMLRRTSPGAPRVSTLRPSRSWTEAAVPFTRTLSASATPAVVARNA